MKNYFAILGCDRTSDEVELREARRLLSRDVHPDHGGDAETMMLLNEAFVTLTKGRAKYLALLKGLPPCGACNGEGVTKMQKTFTRVVNTTCTACLGAGVIGLEH